MAPQVCNHPEARTTESFWRFTVIERSLAQPAQPTTPKAERLRTVRALALKEATERYNHELTDDEERQEVLDRIKRLRRAVETDAETVDAVHSGLDWL
jgi:hypothetical protein